MAALSIEAWPTSKTSPTRASTPTSSSAPATAGNNIISGGDLADTLSGLAGNDTLEGGLGADTLIGGDGNDVLRSVPTMSGDVGDTTTSTTLATGHERRLSTAVESDVSLCARGQGRKPRPQRRTRSDGTGNALNNIINGNDAANQLFGGGGNDTLNGDDGNDLHRWRRRQRHHQRRRRQRHHHRRCRQRHASMLAAASTRSSTTQLTSAMMSSTASMPPVARREPGPDRPQRARRSRRRTSPPGCTMATVGAVRRHDRHRSRDGAARPCWAQSESTASPMPTIDASRLHPGRRGPGSDDQRHRRRSDYQRNRRRADNQCAWRQRHRQRRWRQRRRQRRRGRGYPQRRRRQRHAERRRRQRHRHLCRQLRHAASYSNSNGTCLTGDWTEDGDETTQRDRRRHRDQGGNRHLRFDSRTSMAARFIQRHQSGRRDHRCTVDLCATRPTIWGPARVSSSRPGMRQPVPGKRSPAARSKHDAMAATFNVALTANQIGASSAIRFTATGD